MQADRTEDPPAIDAFAPLRYPNAFTPISQPPTTESQAMAEQYIYTIERLSKAFAKREVLKNIWLAFYPGAKIGVIGNNGSGKSSLLRIMAQVDKDFLGTARLTAGFSVGFVPQEPRLDETIDVRGNIEQAVAPQ